MTEITGLSQCSLTPIARRLRAHVISMTTAAGSGHPGGSLSAADLVAALYFGVMRHDPQHPDLPDRDRLVLSKGHAAPVLYAALAEAGYFPVEWLSTLRRLGSPLQGHPSRRSLSMLEASTGSLGQGLSIGVGLALAGRMDRLPSRVFVLLGDGELQEGQVWEAAMSAAHYHLGNLIALVDCNGFQLDGPISEVMEIEPLSSKWHAFGWDVREIDGHDFAQIVPALQGGDGSGRPRVVLARTVKGKGVSFVENNNEFHGKALTAEQAALALAELEEA